jgi:superfamily II RNA helicase
MDKQAQITASAVEYACRYLLDEYNRQVRDHERSKELLKRMRVDPFATDVQIDKMSLQIERERQQLEELRELLRQGERIKQKHAYTPIKPIPKAPMTFGQRMRYERMEADHARMVQIACDYNDGKSYDELTKKYDATISDMVHLLRKLRGMGLITR